MYIGLILGQLCNKIYQYCAFYDTEREPKMEQKLNIERNTEEDQSVLNPPNTVLYHLTNYVPFPFKLYILLF